MTLTLNLPDEFAAFLPSNESDVAEIVSAGLRQRQGLHNAAIEALGDVTEFLATLPSPEEVLAMHPSEQLAARTEVLLDKGKNSGLSAEEQSEWEDILRIEHLVRIAKAKALIKLKADGKAA